MAILSELTSIVARLKSRFKLAYGVIPGSFGLSEVITPVTQVDELLHEQKYFQDDLNLNVAVNVMVVAATCPEGKRWKMQFARIALTTAATYVVVKPTRSETNHIYVGPGTTALRIVNLYGIIIEPGGSFGLLGTNDAGDAARKPTFFYLEEDAF